MRCRFDKLFKLDRRRGERLIPYLKPPLGIATRVMQSLLLDFFARRIELEFARPSMLVRLFGVKVPR